MMKEKNKKTVLIALVAIVIASVFTVNAVAAQNLLTNPGAETGDMSGWTIIENGGDGWAVCDSSTPLPWCAPYEGDYNFATSFGWCKRSQEVDLLAKDYTEAQLDVALIANAEEWFGEVWDADYYYLKVALLDVNHAVIDSWYSGICKTDGSAGYSDDRWYQLAHTFSGYGPGLRYIYWEDGSKDSEWWNRHYGAKLDAASLTLTVPASVTIKPKTLNLASTDEFTAFITLPEPYDITDIDISTVECEGAPAVEGMVADDNKYIAKFDRQDLRDDLPTGDAVTLTVTGKLYDGTPFEGSDTIRVIDKGKGK